MRIGVITSEERVLAKMAELVDRLVTIAMPTIRLLHVCVAPSCGHYQKQTVRRRGARLLLLPPLPPVLLRSTKLYCCGTCAERPRLSVVLRHGAPWEYLHTRRLLFRDQWIDKNAGINENAEQKAVEYFHGGKWFAVLPANHKRTEVLR